MSNIWTDVVGHFEGEPITICGVNKGLSFNFNLIYNKKIGYKPTFYDAAAWETNILSGEIYGTGKYPYESTVENIACSIIYHEWYGHLMNFYNDSTHYKAYLSQMFSPLWSRTTELYKHFIFIYSITL